MMLTKHIFDYLPIPEKKTGGVEDMEFQRVLKKACKKSRIDLKRSGFSRGGQEKVMCIFYWYCNF